MIMKEMHFQITGIHDEDDFVKADVDRIVTTFANKTGDLFKKCEPCEVSLDMVVKKHDDSKGRNRKIKYSVHAKMQTPFGLITAEAGGFGKLSEFVRDCLGKTEREIMTRHDKMIRK